MTRYAQLFALSTMLLLPVSASSSQDQTLEFEGDQITVDPKTGSSSVETMAVKVGLAEAHINDYLNDSRFKVRSGLEQAFKDYRVWFRGWNHREDAAIVRVIKFAIGGVYNAISSLVPTQAAWQKMLKSAVVTPAMQQLTAEEKSFRASNVSEYLDLMEKKYGEYVLDKGMQVYDAFKRSPEYQGLVDLLMEDFEEVVLNVNRTLPPQVLRVLDAQGVPPPTDQTREKARECALIALVADTLRPVRVPTGGAGSVPIWAMANFDSAEDLARDVVGTAILQRSPFKICR